MAKKVPFYALWEFKSIPAIIIVLLISSGLLFFPTLRDAFNANRLSKLDGETEAYILNIEERDHINMSLNGNKIERLPYVVKYEYVLEDIAYQNTETISPVKWLNHQKAISNDSINHTFMVRYDPNNPTKSMLVLRNLANN